MKPMSSISRASARKSLISGFTLLEAIVAMVIMATSLLTLYAWLGSTTIAVGRAQATVEGLRDGEAALAHIEGINPMQTPNGEHKIDSLSIRWASTPMTEIRTGVTGAGSPAPYQFVLYQVSVRTLRNGKITQSFEVRRLGWVSTHTFDPDVDL